VKSGVVTEEDVLFAPTKAYERSEQKLLDYTKETQARLAKAGLTKPESSLYCLKDILRGSVTSDSPHQTKAIFAMLTNLPGTKVVLIKNGFANKKNGDAFDPAE